MSTHELAGLRRELETMRTVWDRQQEEITRLKRFLSEGLSLPTMNGQLATHVEDWQRRVRRAGISEVTR